MSNEYRVLESYRATDTQYVYFSAIIHDRGYYKYILIFLMASCAVREKKKSKTTKNGNVFIV